jgi:periplasmic divalent cation tolerance protein
MAMTKGRTPARVALIVAAYPNRASAARCARQLVRDGTLACATVAAGATAFYRWQGTFHEEPSVLLWGKTAWRRAAAAVAAIAAIHPDRVPEILALEVDKTPAAYAAWVTASSARAATPGRVAAARGGRR